MRRGGWPSRPSTAQQLFPQALCLLDSTHHNNPPTSDIRIGHHLWCRWFGSAHFPVPEWLQSFRSISPEAISSPNQHPFIQVPDLRDPPRSRSFGPSASPPQKPSGGRPEVRIQIDCGRGSPTRSNGAPKCLIDSFLSSGGFGRMGRLRGRSKRDERRVFGVFGLDLAVLGENM